MAEAQRLIKSKSYAEAEKILLNIVATRPTDAIAWHELGNTRYRNKDFVKAVEAFRRRYDLEPNNHIANYSLGIAFIEVGQVAEARRHLKRALEIKPDFYQARQRLDRLGPVHEIGRPQSTYSPSGGKGPGSSGINSPQRPSNVTVGGSPSGSTPSEQLNEQFRRGRTDPGQLLFSGHQRLGIYWGRFMFAGVLVMVGLALVISVSSRPAQGTALLFFVFTIVLAILLVISAVLSARSTRYRIYERRIDFERGIINRSADSVWLFEVKNPTYHQPLSLRLSGTAEVALKTEEAHPTYITGILGAQETYKMWEEMRDAIVTQRYIIKGQWI